MVSKRPVRWPIDAMRRREPWLSAVRNCSANASAFAESNSECSWGIDILFTSSGKWIRKKQRWLYFWIQGSTCAPSARGSWETLTGEPRRPRPLRLSPRTGSLPVLLRHTLSLRHINSELLVSTGICPYRTYLGRVCLGCAGSAEGGDLGVFHSRD